MKRLAAVLVALSGILVGCSGGLSKNAAGEAIDKALQGANVSLLLEFGRVGTKCADEAARVSNINPTSDIQYIATQKAGFMTITPDGADFWKVEMKGVSPTYMEAAKKIRHLTANGCDYQPFVLALASKRLVDVTNINQLTDATAEAEFRWKWTLTSQGAKFVDQLSTAQITELDWHLHNSAFSQPDSRFSLTDISQSTLPHTAKLTLKRADDGWHVAK